MEFKHVNPFHIPRTREEFVIGLATHAAMAEAFNLGVTYIINENLARHYAETKTPAHARHYQSYRGPNAMERFGRSLGLFAMSSAAPTIVASVGTAVLAGAHEGAKKRMQRESPGYGANPFAYTTPYSSGFGSVV